MESFGVDNRIQVSPSTHKLLSPKYNFEERGKMQIKGKGEMVTYLYTGPKTAEEMSNFARNSTTELTQSKSSSKPLQSAFSKTLLKESSLEELLNFSDLPSTIETTPSPVRAKETKEEAKRDKNEKKSKSNE